MSVDTYRREVARHHDEITKLQKHKADETKKAADHAKRAASATQSAHRASSLSTAQSKLKEAERHRDDQNRAAMKAAEYDRKIAQEHDRLASAQSRLAREEAAVERKRQQDHERQRQQYDRQQREHERQSREVAAELSIHARQHADADARIQRLEALPERIVVLFLAANPVNGNQMRLDEEVRAITEMIRGSKHRDSVKLESCWAVRPQDVLQAINEHRPRIVHFSGHGTVDDEIVFQDDAGQAKFVSLEAMVQLMQACSADIRLVFFNTCHSQKQAEAIAQHIDAAIGMRTRIQERAARVFSSQFYSAIGFGLSVAEAFEQAKALLMMEGTGAEDVPALCTRVGLEPDELILVRPPDTQAANAGASKA